MKDFNHDNILNLIGVVLEAGHVYVILPFMKNGDLRTFIGRPEMVSLYSSLSLSQVTSNWHET